MFHRFCTETARRSANKSVGRKFGRRVKCYLMISASGGARARSFPYAPPSFTSRRARSLIFVVAPPLPPTPSCAIKRRHSGPPRRARPRSHFSRSLAITAHAQGLILCVRTDARRAAQTQCVDTPVLKQTKRLSPLIIIDYTTQFLCF